MLWVRLFMHYFVLSDIRFQMGKGEIILIIVIIAMMKRVPG